jgi:hypothetical protein
VSEFLLKATVNGASNTIGSFYVDSGEKVSRGVAVALLRILADSLEAGFDDDWWNHGWGEDTATAAVHGETP